MSVAHDSMPVFGRKTIAAATAAAAATTTSTATTTNTATAANVNQTTSATATTSAGKERRQRTAVRCNRRVRNGAGRVR